MDLKLRKIVLAGRGAIPGVNAEPVDLPHAEGTEWIVYYRRRRDGQVISAHIPAVALKLGAEA